MKGLKLFVRPAEPADEPEVRAFLTQLVPKSPRFSAPGSQQSRQGDGVGEADGRELGAQRFLLGKLLGELVAVAGFHFDANDLRVDCIVVREALRKKRIGRVMLRELEGLAAQMDKRQISVDDAGQAAAFFERVGFRSEGERWVKSVALQSS